MIFSWRSRKAKKELNQLIKESDSAKKIAHITHVFLKNITESLPQYVFWKDIDSVYLGCNKNFSTLVGLNSPEDIIGKTDIDLNWQTTGHTTNTFQQGDQDTIAGKNITNQEEVLSLPSGTILITLVSKLPIVDNGKIIGIVGYFTDITEIKNKEKELTKAIEQAEAANKAKSAFIANISHDIRTPLTGMIGMAKIILNKLKGTDEEDAANNILKAGNVLLELLNEVIEITKIESGNLPIYEVKFSIKEILNNIVTLVNPSASEKQITFNVEYDNSVPNYLLGDQTRIHRILLNLISNAIKFTEKGSVSIVIKLAKAEARNVVIKCIVKDTGIGIPEEKQQIIFSRFHRLDPSYKGSYKGSGLGLSIVKQFVSDLEGEIYVDSKLGEGSTFTCVIPLKKALLDESENKADIKLEQLPIYGLRESELISPAGFKQEGTEAILKTSQEKSIAHILLVEDNKIVQLAASHQLKELGCSVDVADTGEQAIELFKKNKYDLVFMDIGLPDKDGCKVTTEIRSWEKLNKQHTPIVALTAHIDHDNNQACLNAGMEKVLTKPLTDEKANMVLNMFVYQADFTKIEEKATPSTDGIPVIDLPEGIKLVGGDERIARETLSLFVESLGEIKDHLTLFYEQANWQQLTFDVHKLHGGAAYCGVPRLKAKAKVLENCLKNKDTANVKDRYSDLMIEIENVVHEYKKLN